MDNDQNIIQFLRLLSNAIENNQLNNYQKKKVTDFFSSYLIDEQMSCRGEGDIEENNEDFIKFVFLGWYIYSIISKNEE
jgi:hypothetical protein